MMRSQRGAHFDPKILDCFLDSMDKVEDIRIGYKNQS
jgi:response regulator RpfG family c-di-GMP phosphodiesterase